MYQHLLHSQQAKLLFRRSKFTLQSSWKWTRCFSSGQPIDQLQLQPGEIEVLADYSEVSLKNTRNFCIIAHVDHGKSTLADRLLQQCKNIGDIVKGQEQILDTLQVERERGITVKAQTASILYEQPISNSKYLLNLIDTPGHVDFAYEVSRSLAACQGALLLVDCAQGVQAQTVANYYAALDAGLKILPVLTKIDLPTADPEPALRDLETTFNIDPDSVIWTSAKSGEGCDEIFPAIIDRLPSPINNSFGRNAPLRALVVDSWYDKYRGVICLLQIVDGKLYVGQNIQLASTSEKYTVQEIGLLTPQKRIVDSITAGMLVFDRDKNTGERLKTYRNLQGQEPAALRGKKTNADGAYGGLAAGQVGYAILGMKATHEARVGDTMLDSNMVSMANAASATPVSEIASDSLIELSNGQSIYAANVSALPGFEPATPKVFASIYPVDSGDFQSLRHAVERLLLNDASVSVSKENSSSLGFGYRCGFLGLLHMDVFHQRLNDEFEMPVIATAPTVPYELVLRDGGVITVERPGDFPEEHLVAEYREPTVRARLITPADRLSAVMSLLHDRRGTQQEVQYLDDTRVVLTYELPWAEVVSDFFDSLKSLTAGYASFDYEPLGMKTADIVKVDLLLNKQAVDALSFVVHREKAEEQARRVALKLKGLIRRQQFEIVIQAAVGNKIFAKERIPPFRKDVLIKSGKTVGGGDVTRKRKLLEKQKRGKARLKTVGSVQLSQEAFLSLMSRGSGSTPSN